MNVNAAGANPMAALAKTMSGAVSGAGTDSDGDNDGSGGPSAAPPPTASAHVPSGSTVSTYA